MDRGASPEYWSGHGSSSAAAAAEAGASRTVGGIHFRVGNEDGLAAGRAISAEILATKLLRLHGPTHFGRCPI